MLVCKQSSFVLIFVLMGISVFTVTSAQSSDPPWLNGLKRLFSIDTYCQIDSIIINREEALEAKDYFGVEVFCQDGRHMTRSLSTNRYSRS